MTWRNRGRDPVTVDHTVAPRDVDATIERARMGPGPGARACRRKPLEPPVPVIPGRA